MQLSRKAASVSHLPSKTLSCSYPRKRIIVNSAPTSIRKVSLIYDLLIAIGVLVTVQALPSEALEGAILAGELSLDGSLREVFRRLFVAEINAIVPALIPGIEVILVACL